MTTQPHEFQLARPASLIAALPAVLGFVPEKSLVLVTLDAGELGCVMRVDLSPQLADTIEHLAGVAATACPDGAIAVIVDDGAAECQVCSDDQLRLAEALAIALAGHGIELLAVHIVDRVAAGGQWHCVDGCGSGGVIDDPLASPLAAAAVADGRRLYRDRAELQHVIAPADRARSVRLTAAIEHRIASAKPLTERDARRAVEGAIRLAVRVSGGSDPRDGELAALACALTDSRVRDTLYSLAVGDCAGPAEQLWATMSRLLPRPWRADALVLLAFSAYARGDGPLAGISLEAALACDGEHRMAGMLDHALQAGMRPEQIRELALTGYQMADQLGVRLPPRRAFGQRAS